MKKTEQINYAMLNEKLVMQAIEAAGYEMNTELANQFLQLKVSRMKEMLENRHKAVDWHTEA